MVSAALHSALVIFVRLVWQIIVQVIPEAFAAGTLSLLRPTLCTLENPETGMFVLLHPSPLKSVVGVIVCW